MNSTGLCSVEWSDSQKCFHIDEIEVGIHSSAERLLISDEAGDWTLLAICPSRDDAHLFIDKFDALLEKKGVVRPKL